MNGSAQQYERNEVLTIIEKIGKLNLRRRRRMKEKNTMTVKSLQSSLLFFLWEVP